MAVKKRLSIAEFEAIRPFLRISADRVDAARHALVEGIKYQRIADEFGWTRQAVGNLVRDVWETVERHRESQKRILNSSEIIPEGWEKVTLITPSFLIPKFREEIAKAIAYPENRTSDPTKDRPEDSFSLVRKT